MKEKARIDTTIYRWIIHLIFSMLKCIVQEDGDSAGFRGFILDTICLIRRLERNQSKIVRFSCDLKHFNNISDFG